MSIVAVIPTRGGSKGLPGKAMKEVDGMSLLGHAIQQGYRTCNHVVVVTDSEEHAREAHSWGATWVKVPWEVGDQDMPTAQEHHALTHFPEAFRDPSVLVRLFITHPLRADDDVHRTVRACIQTDQPAVTIAQAPFRNHQLVERDTLTGQEGKLRGMYPPRVARQEVPPPAWYVCGVAYAIRPEQYHPTTGFLPDEFQVVEVHPIRAVDVDTQQDLELVRALWPVRAELETLGDV